MDRIERLAELRREVAPYPNSAACKVLHHLLTMMIEVLQEEQLTTVEPTPTVPTEEERWAVGANTHLKMIESLQSDPVDTKNGPAGQPFVLGQWKLRQIDHDQDSNNLPRVITLECVAGVRAGQLESFVRIAAQDVPLGSSTSVKQPSKESVENSAEESVKLPSNESNEPDTRLNIRY